MSVLIIPQMAALLPRWSMFSVSKNDAGWWQKNVFCFVTSKWEDTISFNIDILCSEVTLLFSLFLGPHIFCSPCCEHGDNHEMFQILPKSQYRSSTTHTWPPSPWSWCAWCRPTPPPPPPGCSPATRTGWPGTSPGWWRGWKGRTWSVWWLSPVPRTCTWESMCAVLLIV